VSERIVAVVLARDRTQPTRETLTALLAQDPPADSLLLIDNDATPEVRAVLEDATPMGMSCAPPRTSAVPEASSSDCVTSSIISTAAWCAASTTTRPLVRAASVRCAMPP
jgi:hypothetical protein